MNNKHSVVFPLTYRLSGQYLSGSILSGSSLLPNFAALHLDVNSIVCNKISAKVGTSFEIKNIGLRLKSLYFCRKEGHFLLDGFEQTHGYAALQGNLKPIWLSDVQPVESSDNQFGYNYIIHRPGASEAVLDRAQQQDLNTLFWRLVGQFSKGELRQTVLFVPDECVDLKTDTRSNNKYLLDEVRLIVSVEYETPSA